MDILQRTPVSLWYRLVGIASLENSATRVHAGGGVFPRCQPEETIGGKQESRCPEAPIVRGISERNSHGPSCLRLWKGIFHPDAEDFFRMQEMFWLWCLGYFTHYYGARMGQSAFYKLASSSRRECCESHLANGGTAQAK